MQISNEQFRAARAMLGLTQAEIAELAGLSLQTVWNAERHGAVRPTTKAKIAKALRSKGIKFAKNGVWKSV